MFGCLAFYYVPKNYRNKLGVKAKKGIFIGYSTSTRSYRIYDPTDGKVYASRTVKFREQILGSTLLENQHETDNNVDKFRYEADSVSNMEKDDEYDELVISNKETDQDNENRSDYEQEGPSELPAQTYQVEDEQAETSA